ncbi:hypothetical protein HZB93_01175 [Candidatus Falkowbacteria bacterium]|nr:hypothetical protein [Candidatus Falkowbacteria bacterium]
MQYSFDNSKKVPVAVVHCLDYRFVEQTNEFVRKELNLKGRYTPYTFPGGPRVYTDGMTRNVFLHALREISVSHHKITRAVFIAHRDCGAWGGSAAFSSLEEERAAQENDMRAAKKTLNREFPDVEVDLYYLEIVSMTGDEGRVEFQPVK